MPSGAGSERTEKLPSAVGVEWKNPTEQNLPNLHSISTVLFLSGIRWKIAPWQLNSWLQTKIRHCDKAIAKRCDAGVKLPGRERSCRQHKNRKRLLTEGKGQLLIWDQLRPVVEYFQNSLKTANNLVFSEGSFMRGLFWDSRRISLLICGPQFTVHTSSYGYYFQKIVSDP